MELIRKNWIFLIFIGIFLHLIIKRRYLMTRKSREEIHDKIKEKKFIVLILSLIVGIRDTKERKHLYKI